MLKGLLQISGMLTLWIVYGKKYSEKAANKFGLMILLSIANIFWLLSILFLATGSAANDTALCIILAIGYPIAITIWAIISRKKIANEQNLSHEIEIKTEDSEVSTIPPISEETIPSSEIAINVPDEIKQYKELLDSGAITQEEYDAKKKQLLEL